MSRRVRRALACIACNLCALFSWVVALKPLFEDATPLNYPLILWLKWIESFYYRLFKYSINLFSLLEFYLILLVAVGISHS